MKAKITIEIEGDEEMHGKTEFLEGLTHGIAVDIISRHQKLGIGDSVNFDEDFFNALEVIKEKDVTHVELEWNGATNFTLDYLNGEGNPKLDIPNN